MLGFYRFVLGLSKKVIIANALGEFADHVYGNEALKLEALNPSNLSAATAWLAALSYTFQLYFDFSGYSDMAIGLGRMLGFHFPENFNNPYISQSITEFWRRWHMTLGAWMRNYLYIPLGGNRVSTKRLYFNLWLVFLLSGLWHGASWNFVLWGAWHGLFLVIERAFLLRYLEKAGRLISNAYAFLVVLIGWIFFRVETFNAAWGYVKALFGAGSGSESYAPDREWMILTGLAVLFAFFLYLPKGDRIQDTVYGVRNPNNFTHIWLTLACGVLFILSLSFVTASNFNPFIYFRF